MKPLQAAHLTGWNADVKPLAASSAVAPGPRWPALVDAIAPFARIGTEKPREIIRFKVEIAPLHPYNHRLQYR